MKVNVKLGIGVLLLAFSLCSCGGSNEVLPPPDVSGIKSDVKILRFDRAMMGIDTSDIAGGIDRLDQDYGSFSDVFLKHIIPLRRGDFSPEEQLNIMRAFLTFPLIQHID
jgi:hypothetical protein